MKRLLFFPAVILMLLTLPQRATASVPVSLVDETLTYDVIYKWGFINRVA